MNPRPTMETLEFCYPVGYGPHESLSGSGRNGDEAQAFGNTDGQSDLKTERSTTEASNHTPWYLSRPVRAIPGLKWFYCWLVDDRSEFLPVPVNPDSKAIELGCATGKYLSKLRSMGWQAEGVELVESAAAAARELGFSTHVGTLDSAELSGDHYDGAFAWHVLEHVPDPRGVLAEFHRILKDDAYLAFSVPNVACWEPRIFGRNWYVWELPRHLQFYSPSSIRQLLKETGFKEIKVVHQRTLLNIVGSTALLVKRFLPESRLAEKLLAYPDHPTMWWQLLMAPMAIFLATIGQGGRLTVIARCNKSSHGARSAVSDQTSE
ncbi:MAG: class I SAM-dependent methyltransferase [Planctomycetaceae bacterium]|nr:class I SAM-dependent methyltransferase [Planctomycetaceae bacterium]